jgi:plasmid rolling circle replication initiator protein Rep
MHAAPTAVQVTSAHEGQFDPLGKFTKHRRFNAPITRALMADPETLDIGRAIGNCACRLNLELPLEGEHLGEPLLRGARVCNRRLCPFCEWRRTRAWRARLMRGLDELMLEHPNRSALFLTLTVRNCQLGELRETINHMHASFKRMTKVAAFPTDQWFRRTEITVKRELQDFGGDRPRESCKEPIWAPQGRILSVHPHIHALLIVRPSYWGKHYVKQLRWQQEWQMAARLDYAPVVDVRRAKAKGGLLSHDETGTRAAVLEAAKYASKATDLLALGGQLPEFHHEIKGVRLYGVSKSLQRYVKSTPPSADDLLDSCDLDASANDQTLSAIAQWFEASQDYRFVV